MKIWLQTGLKLRFQDKVYFAIARSFEDFVASYDFLQGQVSWSQNKLILQLKGKSAHGSKPEAGHNAQPI